MFDFFWALAFFFWNAKNITIAQYLTFPFLEEFNSLDELTQQLLR